MRLPLIPGPVARLLAILPQYPPSLALCMLLDLALEERLHSDDFEPLYGKVVCIRVTDAGLLLNIGVERTGFVSRSAATPADVTISAAARDFALLATRKEDPDTLFFSRRLSIEGDTGLGLFVKNTLDAIDLRALRLPSPSRLIELLLSRLGRVRQRV